MYANLCTEFVVFFRKIQRTLTVCMHPFSVNRVGYSTVSKRLETIKAINKCISVKRDLR